MKRISRQTEGAVILLAGSVALLVYGYANEDEQLFSLSGATFPGIALSVLLVFSAWQAISRNGDEESGDSRPLSFLEAGLIALLCGVYLTGVIYVGVVVSTAVGLIASMSLLSWRISLYPIVVSVATSVVVWLIFERLGNVYFPSSWLF